MLNRLLGQTLGCCLLALGLGIAQVGTAQIDSSGLDLLSLDSLLNMRISSVSKYEQTTSEAAASVTIIAKEDILSFGYDNLAELLTAVRDLYISDDRNYAYLGIRGFSRPTDFNNRIAIMVNGVLLNENIWGQGPIGSDLYGLNLDDVERVEVIRGPASSLYGNFPILGMINVVTQSGRSLDGAKASVEQGSYGKWQGSAAVGKLLKNGLDFNVGLRVGRTGGQNLYYAEYDDSTTNNGIADHRNASQYYGIHGLVAYKNFTFKVLHTWRDIGVPTGAYGSLFNDPRTHTIDSYSFADLSYERELSAKVSLQGRAWVNRFNFIGEFPYDSITGGVQREATHTLKGCAEARLRWDVTSNNRVMVGGEFNHHFQAQYALQYTNRQVFDQNFPFSTFGFYFQNEYQPLEQLTITAGLRYDRLYLGRNALTPRLAVNFAPHKNTMIKALYGVAFRAPTIYEVNVGFDGFILPNYNLRPELIQNLELLCEQRFSKRYYGVVSVYTNRLVNVIEQISAGGALLQFQNVLSTGGFGASAEFNGRFESGMHFYSNYGFVMMRNLLDDKWLSNSPQHMVKLGVAIPLPLNLQLSPEVVVQSARLTVYNTQTSPFVLANVNLLFSPNFGGKASGLNRLQLAFKVRNVLNTDYRYPGGNEHLQPAIQQNGINYNLKLMVNLF
jgi:outer membrane receptor for ferrienterochelin and colicins